MKTKVVSPYTDIETGEVHMTGETVELTEERFGVVSGRGYVVAAEEQQKQVKRATTRKRATAKKAPAEK